jgi:uncharacterized membrane protein
MVHRVSGFGSWRIVLVLLLVGAGIASIALIRHRDWNNG